MNRREFLATPALATLIARPDLCVAPFSFDVTPPMGHSLCGGWIKPAVAIEEKLSAIGYVVTGIGDPIVICAVDWTGILNDAHLAWRKALAEGAGTTADRVAVHCVHPHNAPFACLASQTIVDKHRELPPIIDRDFFSLCLDHGRAAVKTAMGRLRRVTHIGRSRANVDKVASNRRIHRDAGGKVLSMRGSSTKSQKLMDMPEGEIDPWLRTVTYFNGDEAILTCHSYACHPMSYYGDGRIMPDFVGLARISRQKATPRTTQMYLTGCAGNIAAGKYNDGEPATRAVLMARVREAMVASEKVMAREPIGSAKFSAVEVKPKYRGVPTIAELEAQISDPRRTVVQRNRPAYQLAFAKRCAVNDQPIIVSGLTINDVSLVHLPAECFVEYQLQAQKSYPDRFVLTAAYGDGGPWYVPTKTEIASGGYEVEQAYADSMIDDQLTRAMNQVLS